MTVILSVAWISMLLPSRDRVKHGLEKPIEKQISSILITYASVNLPIAKDSIPTNKFADSFLHRFHLDSMRLRNIHIKIDSSLFKSYLRNSMSKADSSTKQIKKLATNSIESTAENVLRGNSYNKVLRKVDIVRSDSISRNGIGIIHSDPFEEFKAKQLFVFNGGFVSYNFSYRSNLDTPFVQSDLIQHLVTGNLRFSAGNFPLSLTFLGRKSNSIYFKDIYDARLEYDAFRGNDKLLSGIRRQLISRINSIKDSLSDDLYPRRLTDFESRKREFDLKFTPQRLVEMNEIIRVKSISYDVTLPDSLARKKSDSLISAAESFIQLYTSEKNILEKEGKVVDSLKQVYYGSLLRIKSLKEILGRNFNNWQDLQEIKKQVREISGDRFPISKKYEWLLGLRNLGIGKSSVNYSELTAKNINVNGVNIEYNSWYYLALTAGFVDYRFRDFFYQPFRRTPQYLYMVRTGVGSVEHNHIIVTAFKGQKQLYAPASSKMSSFNVSGIAVELKYFLLKNTFAIAEVGKTSTPGLQSNTTSKSFWTLSDKSNQAYSFQLYSYIPQTSSRIEAMYKYTGANYQSFNSFQSNSSLTSWYVKAEQSFFKRRLRLLATLRANEFSNPYIIQAYKSNTIFKSIQANFHRTKWPTLSIGYTPMSQLTKVENQLIENRFQTFNATANHYYKLGTQQSTTIVFTKFFNTATDTGFAYFNASNILIAQNFFFKSFSALAGYSQTRNRDYMLNVLEGNIEVPVGNILTVGIGSKVNSLNNSDVKVGYSGKFNLRSGMLNGLYLTYEKGYLSSKKGQLVSNDFLNIGITKSFR
jgi:hypothetical protein